MSIYKNKNLLALKGKLFKFPTALINYIADIFSHGWDRNRTIDTLGTNNNALMGGYLLAVSNTTITISGLLITDTLLALTTNGLVGTIATNNIIRFTAGNKYGAFEVYRGTSRIGRYCLTERQGLQIINQVTGGLSNGLLGGTTTTVWQRSNAFYSETNERGYSISGTGWVTSAGETLTIGTIIPADPLNPTKCMAWVSSVQQDLQYVGKAKNSVSVVPITFVGTSNSKWGEGSYALNCTKHEIECVLKVGTQTFANIYGYDFNVGTGSKSLMTRDNTRWQLVYPTTFLDNFHIEANGIFKVRAGFDSGTMYVEATNLITGRSETVTKQYGSSTLIVPNTWADIFKNCTDWGFGYIKESIDGIVVRHYVADQHTTKMFNLVSGAQLSLTGVSTNMQRNVDLLYMTYVLSGYELWTNGTTYLIYPLKYNGTRIITPAGYALVETVTAGNMPSVADSRMSTFKYALANSYAVRQSVPDAFDTTDPCAPKLLTYTELSALSANPKVTKTEVNGKITNLTIRQ